MNIRSNLENKIISRERLTREDARELFGINDICWLGNMATIRNNYLNKNHVYFNVNHHINLTNICRSRCKFCAFGCSSNDKHAYEMTKDEVLSVAKRAIELLGVNELHIVSGLHPEWEFDYYVDIIHSLHSKFPNIHLKAFTAVEVVHFSQIARKSIKEILEILKNAGVQSMPGGGAEILSDRVRNQLCPNKATALQWLETMKIAHGIGLKSNASMLYGHIETVEEKVSHLLSLRDLQDKTSGFQTFICFPFLPTNTDLEPNISRVSAWEDIKTIAISRLILDNFKNIKAYWVMLTLPIAQLALGFGANDIDGTVSEEKIMHAAGASSEKYLSKEKIIETIRVTGHIPVERDSLYNVIAEY